MGVFGEIVVIVRRLIEQVREGSNMTIEAMDKSAAERQVRAMLSVVTDMPDHTSVGMTLGVMRELMRDLDKLRQRIEKDGT